MSFNLQPQQERKPRRLIVITAVAVAVVLVAGAAVALTRGHPHGSHLVGASHAPPSGPSPSPEMSIYPVPSAKPPRPPKVPNETPPTESPSPSPTQRHHPSPSPTGDWWFCTDPQLTQLLTDVHTRNHMPATLAAEAQSLSDAVMKGAHKYAGDHTPDVRTLSDDLHQLGVTLSGLGFVALSRRLANVTAAHADTVRLEVGCPTF